MHEVKKKSQRHNVISWFAYAHSTLAMLPLISKQYAKRVLSRLAEKNTTCTSDAVH